MAQSHQDSSMDQLAPLVHEDVKLPRAAEDALLVNSHLLSELKIHKGKMKCVKKTDWQHPRL